MAPPIEIGPANISDVSVVYGDFHIFKVWDLEKRPAMLIGMDVLGTVDALVIDFRRRELYLLSGSAMIKGRRCRCRPSVASIEASLRTSCRPVRTRGGRCTS